MLALTGIGVLVQRGAIEARQAVGIVGEMRADPINDHAQTGLVTAVHEAGKGFRGAVARRRCVDAQRLVAPGATKGMLTDRQQLDVGEAQPGDVGDQPIRQCIPIQHAAILGALPGSRVYLIDGQRRVDALPAAPLQPSLVGPLQRRGRHHA